MLDWMIDNNGSEFFLAIRINHAGDMQIDYATKHGLTFEDANYILGAHPARQEMWTGQVKAKLRPITYAKTNVVYTPATQPYQGTKGTYQGTKTPTTPPAPKEKGSAREAWSDGWDELDPYESGADLFGTIINSPAERSKAIDDITLDELELDHAEIVEIEVPDALIVICDAIDTVLWEKGINHLAFPQEEMWGYAQRKYDEIFSLTMELNGGTDDSDPVSPA